MKRTEESLHSPLQIVPISRAVATADSGLLLVMQCIAEVAAAVPNLGTPDLRTSTQRPAKHAPQKPNAQAWSQSLCPRPWTTGAHVSIHAIPLGAPPKFLLGATPLRHAVLTARASRQTTQAHSYATTQPQLRSYSRVTQLRSYAEPCPTRTPNRMSPPQTTQAHGNAFYSSRSHKWLDLVLVHTPSVSCRIDTLQHFTSPRIRAAGRSPTEAPKSWRPQSCRGKRNSAEAGAGDCEKCAAMRSGAMGRL